jgi:hypothetical protein
MHREFKITFSAIPHPDKWVFLVGCYNSGTTLLRKMLGSHPLVSALPVEGQYLTDQFPSDHEIGLSRMWVLREDLYRLNENTLGPDPTRIQREWGMRLNQSRPIFLEQTPANAARTRWLQEHFQNAYFIGIVRNGYAVAEGIVRKAKPVHLKQGWSIEQAAYQWARSNEILCEDASHLEHFIWCKYEDLAENTEEEIQRILKFLEISEFGGVDLSKKWTVHEREHEIKNLNNESIERLTQEQIDAISLVTKTMLLKFGYDIM